MCNPIVLTGITMLSQAYAAQSTNKQIARQASVGAANAVQEAQFKYQQLQEREYQESVSRAVQITQRARQGIRERAQLMAAVSANAGDSPALAQRLAIASAIQQSEDIDAVRTEEDFSKSQAQFERLGIDLSTKARLAEASALKDTMIPPWMTALNMGVAGYGTYKSLQSSGSNRGSQMTQRTNGSMSTDLLFGTTSQRITRTVNPMGTVLGSAGGLNALMGGYYGTRY